MLNLTMGGIPAEQAYTWTPENRQKLGGIIFLLYSDEWGKRKQAYIDYYELRRHFTLSVWEKEFSKLEHFRAEQGVETIEQMIENVREQLINHGAPKECNFKQQKEGSMQGLRKIGTGLITIGEGLMELAESGFNFGQAVQGQVPEESFGSYPTEPAEKTKPAKQEKKQAEEKTADVDPVKLREELKKGVLALVKVDRQKAVDLLAEFDAKKLPDIADDMLEGFAARLEVVKNG